MPAQAASWADVDLTPPVPWWRRTRVLVIAAIVVVLAGATGWIVFSPDGGPGQIRADGPGPQGYTLDIAPKKGDEGSSVLRLRAASYGHLDFAVCVLKGDKEAHGSYQLKVVESETTYGESLSDWSLTTNKSSGAVEAVNHGGGDTRVSCEEAKGAQRLFSGGITTYILTARVEEIERPKGEDCTGGPAVCTDMCQYDTENPECIALAEAATTSGTADDAHTPKAIPANLPPAYDAKTRKAVLAKCGEDIPRCEWALEHVEKRAVDKAVELVFNPITGMLVGLGLIFGGNWWIGRYKKASKAQMLALAMRADEEGKQ